MNRESLTALFSKLGARHPEVWANSQIDEGIPQLSRFVFLRKAWNLVASSSELSWIDECLKTKEGFPGRDIVAPLSDMLSKGIDKKDIATVVRVMQWKLLFSLCYLLDDPGPPLAEGDDVAWRLFQVDEHELPIIAMGGLHESVLELDPSGNEMGVHETGRQTGV